MGLSGANKMTSKRKWSKKKIFDTLSWALFEGGKSSEAHRGKKKKFFLRIPLELETLGGGGDGKCPGGRKPTYSDSQ